MIDNIQQLLEPFAKVGINKVDGPVLSMLNFATDEVLRLLRQGKVPANEAFRLIKYSHIFANIVAITPYKTTDAWLTEFADDPIKLMFLYTGRNRKSLDTREFFKYDQTLASLWFAQFVLPVIGCTDAGLQQNIERHYKFMHPDCVFLPQSTHAYFWSDYFSPEIARDVKRQFNQSINLGPVANSPQPNHIAIVTGNWTPTHAVIKAVGKIVHALAKDYKLTLVHLGKIDPRAELSIFDRVTQVTANAGGIDPFFDINTFGAALFLDVGLTPESIYMSNLRLAPVQIACHGHPATGCYNKIDYFLSGSLVEDIGASTHYSEKLILLPGSGVLAQLPNYVRRRPPLKGSVRVAVPWSAIKYNADMFQCLNRIKESGATLVFMPGSPIHRYQASIPVRMSMLEYFGTNHIEILPNMPYGDYMEAIERCHFVVDSFPFGGYNTVLEALWCGRPVVTFKGNQWVNRAASYLLDRAGMGELVTSSYAQYTKAAIRLVTDSPWRDVQMHKTDAIDFEHLVGSDQPEDYCQAITTLIQRRLRGVIL